MLQKYEWFWKGFLNSYTQIFFSDNKGFAAILIPVTFLDFFAGLFGMLSVLFTNTAARLIGFDPMKIRRGYYGFNSLLVGLGLGIYYEPGIVLLILLVIAAIFTLFISVTLEGVIGKYHLPHLSLPFVFALWLLMLSSREFYALSLNERGIYTLNDLYVIGGHTLVAMYEWWNQLDIPSVFRTYFLSLGAILFQFSVLSGILVAFGLLIYSRIAFTLSFLGFFAAWCFYNIIGADLTEAGYSYVGFNYILTAIAIGGFFIIPNVWSYFWVLLVVPMVSIVTISLGSVLFVFQLPVYALPFNMVVLIFLYVLKFRISNRAGLHTFFVQRNSPERNLYSWLNYRERFTGRAETPVRLPFFGEWIVTQGHSGPYTHRNDWKYAWDFEMVDEDGKTFRNQGDYPEDYYCFNKPVTAPADGVVEEVIDDIDDNIIGKTNLEQNWGNTVIIKHADDFYSKMSHLRKQSVKVRRGDRVRQGDQVGLCGNSGNSPYPHLHFQLQSTPYVGSKTHLHPVSNYYYCKNGKKNKGGKKKLVETGIPEKDDLVSNIQANASLKRAFQLVPGKIMEFEAEGRPAKRVRWEVKVDNYLNRYVECEESGSKAYFEPGPAMVHFVHFEGDRASLLYYYYLAAYKISFGFESGQRLTDRFALNLVFNPNKMFLQDLAAPFYRYLTATYELNYPEHNSHIPPDDMELTGSVHKKAWNRVLGQWQFRFRLDSKGLREFHFGGEDVQIKAQCV